MNKSTWSGASPERPSMNKLSKLAIALVAAGIAFSNAAHAESFSKGFKRIVKQAKTNLEGAKRIPDKVADKTLGENKPYCVKLKYAGIAGAFTYKTIHSRGGMNVARVNADLRYGDANVGGIWKGGCSGREEG